MNYMSIQGSICMDGWDDRDSSVACKEIGFEWGIAFSAARSEQSGPFWTSNVDCEGTEHRLADCFKTQFGQVRQCTDHYSQAGAICFRDDGKGSVDLDSNNVSNLRNLCCWC